MAVPLFVEQATRHNGVSTLVVVGHGLTSANEGNAITVVGVHDTSFNVGAKISKVIPPDTIRFNQPGLPDVHSALRGGAIAIG